MMKRLLLLLPVALLSCAIQAQSVRETVLLDKGWKFSLGNARDAKQDFRCGTEYFNYLTKANSIHNEGPYAEKFDDADWQEVQVPHDWVTTLPYAAEASHSHGYKTVGWKYPEHSVGWYRKTLTIPAADLGKRLLLRFDGIFRSAQVWFNGFYMGTEPSGYATQVYDITPYVKYGERNLICVRADASLEEGWFYEGAGIYRDVWLEKSAAVSVAPFGTFVYADLKAPYHQAVVHVETEVNNHSLVQRQCEVSHRLLDAEERVVAASAAEPLTLKPMQTLHAPVAAMSVGSPRLWSTTDPYL
jgi:beta-galactosidase